MAEKFANRYRVPSARAAWWNYGWPGAYFITICTAPFRNKNPNITHVIRIPAQIPFRPLSAGINQLSQIKPTNQVLNSTGKTDSTIILSAMISNTNV